MPCRQTRFYRYHRYVRGPITKHRAAVLVGRFEGVEAFPEHSGSLVETLTFPELPYAPHSISGAWPCFAFVAGRNHFGRRDGRILQSRMRFASRQPREIPPRKAVAPGAAPVCSQRALHSPLPHGPLLARPVSLAGPGLGAA